MLIRFINHASFVCEHNGVRLICDPWLYGSAFNDGWDLIVETGFSVEEFSEIEYIWFSHEHPDHFSPRVLLDIPSQIRTQITVLYKQTSDRKVLNFCEKLGFRTLELPDGEKVSLKGEISVRCQRVPLHDSWLLIEAGGKRILNLNDAVVESARDLHRVRRDAGDVDVLFTQFNYAAWRGNREDTLVRRSDAKQKLALMIRQIEYLRPAFTVPFASFSFFSHEENFFTNDASNAPGDAVAAITSTSSVPVLMFPNDVWEVGATHDNSDADARYRREYAAIHQRPLRVSKPTSLETLALAAKGYIQRIEERNDQRMLSILRRNPIFPILTPLEVYLWDLDQNVRFSFEHGLVPIDWRPARYDLRMSSDSLLFMFKNAWGIDTLTVNGRFFADAGGLRRLLATFGVDALNNAGIRLEPAFLMDASTMAFLARIVARKLWSLRTRLPRESPN